jgi:hypothetical protein
LGYDATDNGSGYRSGGTPALPNMQANLVDTGIVNLSGSYWSSTEYSAVPQVAAWLQYFAAGGGSTQAADIKQAGLSVRCSRALSP